MNLIGGLIDHAEHLMHVMVSAAEVIEACVVLMECKHVARKIQLSHK
jgi:hypothetical protein